MKFLGNPWIVGLLGLGAVVVVVFNTFQPRGPKMPALAAGRATPSVVVNLPPPMPGASASPVSSAAAVPLTDIDLDYVRSHLTDWLSVTQRDPFFLAKSTEVISTNQPVRQINQMKLKAIWRQDGIGMAAIDNGIYRVGDIIDSRRVQRIDHNGVWLESAGKKEFIVFSAFAGNTTTNAP